MNPTFRRLHRLLVPLLGSLLLGVAGADYVVAPTPLYATPALNGSPVVTLPTGKPVAVLARQGDAGQGEAGQGNKGQVLTVVYGERLLYARAGTVKSAAAPVLLGGQNWWLPPQSPSAPIRVYLHPQDKNQVAPRNWTLRVLPVSPPTLRGTPVKIISSAVRTVQAKLMGESTEVPLGRLNPGVYLVTAAQADAPAAVQEFTLLEVTNLHLTTLVTPRGVQVWTTRLDTGAVLPGVAVTGLVYESQEQAGQPTISRELPAVTTDAQGLAFVPLRDREQPALAAAVSLDGRIQRTQMGTNEGGLYVISPTRHRIFLQTDKPVYRPGETVQGFAVARRLQPGARQPYQGQMTVQLQTYAAGREISLGQVTVSTDADGLARFALPLPQDVRTGEYSLEAEVKPAASAGNPRPVSDFAYQPVRVQAFVKPQFTLDLSAPSEVTTGSPLTLSAQAELYVGGGANIDGDVFVGDGYEQRAIWADGVQSSDPDWDYAYQEQSEDAWRAPPSLPQDQTPDQRLSVRAGRGSSTLRLSTKGPYPQSYSLLVRAKDEYGRDVLAEQGVDVHPAGLKVVLPAAPQDSPGRVRIQAEVRQVGTDAPLPGRRVDVRVMREFADWSSGQYKDAQEVVLQTSATSDAAGRLTLTLPTGQPGSYQVQLSTRDAAGRETRAEFMAAYVPQPYATAQAPTHTLSLEAKRSRSALGDALTLRLTSTLPVGTPVLLSAAAEDRVTPRVVRVTGKVTEVTWPVTADLSPGFEIIASAVQLGVQGAPALEARTGLLYVPRTDQRLDVQLSVPPGEVKPGAPVTFTVRTARAGRPVSALVTLAGVQESVYAVAGDPSPDPWRFLWGATYPDVILRQSSATPADGLGGGGGGENGLGQFRQDLREVAFYQTVTTGADGAAQVTVTMPEGLGAYRVSARAFTRESAAGEARSSVRVGLPFAVRLSRPRVLTQGDMGSAAVSVQDRAGGSGTVNLSLSVGGQESVQSVPLASGAASVLFSLAAPTSGTHLTLEARATRAAQADALREVLPLRPAGPRTLLVQANTLTQAGTLSDPLSWPADAGVETLSVDLAATPLQLALAGLDAALSDPKERWVTTDAVAARLSANLNLAGIAAALGWADVHARALSQARQDTATLLALLGDQGWGWTASGPATPAMTAHALAALVQAKGANLTSAATLNAAVAVAQAHLTRPALDDEDRTLLLSALARAGVSAGAVAYARAGGPKDSADQARLASALAAAAPDLARTLYERARRSARTTTSGALVLGDAQSWRGDAEPTALLLGAAAALSGSTNPSTNAKLSADLSALTQGVLERRTGSAWPGPQATAEALRALRLRLAKDTSAAPRIVTLRLGDFQTSVQVGAPRRVLIPASAVKAGATLTLSSTGSLAVRRELNVRTVGTPPAPPSLVRVERSYSAAKLERDQIVTVTLTITSPTTQRHLRVVDPLPGGLEAVDDRPFADPGRVNEARSPQVLWAERSLYDDRAVFYLESVKQGTTTIKYQLRALAPGLYTAPAPRVEFSSGAAGAQGSAQKVEVRAP